MQSTHKRSWRYRHTSHKMLEMAIPLTGDCICSQHSKKDGVAILLTGSWRSSHTSHRTLIYEPGDSQSNNLKRREETNPNTELYTTVLKVLFHNVSLVRRSKICSISISSPNVTLDHIQVVFSDSPKSSLGITELYINSQDGNPTLP